MFWSTASYDINAAHTVENIRVSSVMKLAMCFCVTSQCNYHVILHELGVYSLCVGMIFMGVRVEEWSVSMEIIDRLSKNREEEEEEENEQH